MSHSYESSDGVRAKAEEPVATPKRLEPGTHADSDGGLDFAATPVRRGKIACVGHLLNGSVAVREYGQPSVVFERLQKKGAAIHRIKGGWQVALGYVARGVAGTQVRRNGRFGEGRSQPPVIKGISAHSNCIA